MMNTLQLLVHLIAVCHCWPARYAAHIVVGIYGQPSPTFPLVARGTLALLHITRASCASAVATAFCECPCPFIFSRSGLCFCCCSIDYTCLYAIAPIPASPHNQTFACYEYAVSSERRVCLTKVFFLCLPPVRFHLYFTSNTPRLS